MNKSRLIYFFAGMLLSTSLLSQSRFKFDTRGYLMDACQEALEQKNTLAAGYCRGVYSAAMDSLIGIISIGTKWCPTGDNFLDPKINFGIIIKWLKNHPKQWNTSETSYAIQLALKEAYPCNAKQ